MLSDAEIEAYLHTVSSYESERRQASKAWKAAFLSLAKARQSCEVSPVMYDPKVPATTVINPTTGEVEALEARGAQQLMGAWPPKALQSARSEFVAALKHEVQAVHARSSIRI